MLLGVECIYAARRCSKMAIRQKKKRKIKLWDSHRWKCTQDFFLFCIWLQKANLDSQMKKGRKNRKMNYCCCCWLRVNQSGRRKVSLMKRIRPFPSRRKQDFEIHTWILQPDAGLFAVWCLQDAAALKVFSDSIAEFSHRVLSVDRHRGK